MSIIWLVSTPRKKKLLVVNEPLNESLICYLVQNDQIGDHIIISFTKLALVVFIYLYIFVHTQTCIQKHILLHMIIYININFIVHLKLCPCICVYMCVHACAHTHMHACMYCMYMDKIWDVVQSTWDGFDGLDIEVLGGRTGKSEILKF